MRIRASHYNGHWVIADNGQIVDASTPAIFDAFTDVTGQQRSPGPEIPLVELDYSSTYRFRLAAEAASMWDGDIPAEGWTFTDDNGQPMPDTEFPPVGPTRPIVFRES